MVNISTEMVDPKSGKYDNLPHIGPGNIESFTGQFYDNIKKVGEENLISGKFHFYPEDIIYGKINPQLGKYVFPLFEGLSSADSYVLNAKNGLNQKYLYTLLQTTDFYKYSVSVSMRSGMPKINRDELNAYEFSMPKGNEQQQIGALFLEIDNLITLHQRKCFCKKYSWEQRKLLEVADYRNGKAHENDIDDNGKYIVVNSKFVSTNGEIKKFSNKQNEPLLKNELAFVLSDVPNGRALARTFLVDKPNKYTLNQRIAGITPHSDIDAYYLYITMNRNRYFLQFDDGVKQTNLSLDDMQKYIEWYPKSIEQQQIGALFLEIDNLITLHQLKEMKRS